MKGWHVIVVWFFAGFIVWSLFLLGRISVAGEDPGPFPLWLTLAIFGVLAVAIGVTLRWYRLGHGGEP